MCGLFCALFSCSKYFNVSVISCDHYNNHPSRAVTWAQGSEAELRLELRSFTYGSAGWRFLWLRWPQSYLYLLASTVFWEEVWLPWARGSVGVWSSTVCSLSFLQLQVQLIISILCYHLSAHNRLRLPWHDFFVLSSFSRDFLPLWLPLLTLWPPHALWRQGSCRNVYHFAEGSEECSCPCSFPSNS